MTNEELQEIMNNPNGISAEDVDRIWADMKARDAQREQSLMLCPKPKRNASKRSL